MHRVVVVKGCLEEHQVIRAVDIDVGRHVLLVRVRKVVDALLTNSRHHAARRIHAVHRNAVVTGVEKDVAIVVPVVTPEFVPARQREEAGFGQQPVPPVIERLLLGVRKHFETDHHLPPSLMKSPDHAQLHAMKVGRGVRFADQQQPRVAQAGGKLVGGEYFARGRVGDPVQHHACVARAPFRIPDRQVEDLLFGLGGQGKRNYQRYRRHRETPLHKKMTPNVQAITGRTAAASSRAIFSCLRATRIQNAVRAKAESHELRIYFFGAIPLT